MDNGLKQEEERHSGRGAGVERIWRRVVRTGPDAQKPRAIAKCPARGYYQYSEYYTGAVMVKRFVLTAVIGCVFLAFFLPLARADEGNRDFGKGRDRRVRPHRMDRHQHLRMRGEMRRQDRESYRRMVLMALQGDFDTRLRLCDCQQMRLRWLSDRFTDGAVELMHRYFSDRRMDVDEFNHRLTALNQRIGRCARHQLTPFQDKVILDFPWTDYSSECWNEGYHPRAAYVLERLEDEESYIWFPQ
ncbi:hypothetical protein J7J84_02830 [bacterium]|nr:hypothetical protein [bacterium]